MNAALYPGERLNSYSHLLGAVLAAGGAAVLIVLAAGQGNPWKIVSFSVYGAMLPLLYLCSTLYHSLRGRAKDVFRKLDHCAIYLLIAGTYTPFTLVTLQRCLEVVAVWRDLGHGAAGNCGGFVALGKAQNFAGGNLSVHGMARPDCLEAIAGCPSICRLRVAAGGRCVLHRGHCFSRPGTVDKTWARYLALVRAGRQRLPLFRHIFLCGMKAL